MRIKLGNVSQLGADGTKTDLGAPSVTDIIVPDDEVLNADGKTKRKVYALEPGLDVNVLSKHLLSHSDITQLPNHSAVVAVLHSQAGLWSKHSDRAPAWVWSDNEEMTRILSRLSGRPARR